MSYSNYENLPTNIKPLAFMNVITKYIPENTKNFNLKSTLQWNWCSEYFEPIAVFYDPFTDKVNVHLSYDKREMAYYIKTYSPDTKTIDVLKSDILGFPCMTLNYDGTFPITYPTNINPIVDTHAKHIHQHCLKIGREYHQSLLTFEQFVNTCNLHNLNFNTTTGEILCPTQN